MTTWARLAPFHATITRPPAGPHRIEVASAALLTAGAYEVRLTSGGASRSARFVVLH